MPAAVPVTKLVGQVQLDTFCGPLLQLPYVVCFLCLRPLSERRAKVRDHPPDLLCRCGPCACSMMVRVPKGKPKTKAKAGA
eukprot:566756-Amphidinium_carterae.1